MPDTIIQTLLKYRPHHPMFQDDYTFSCTCSLYLFARSFCEGKHVLDAACGYGYGSGVIHEIASRVTGIDLSVDALTYARDHYQAEGLAFECMDVTDLKFPDNTFDRVVSIETFEHLPPEKTEAFLSSIRRVLKPGGLFILSTPVRSVYDKISKTPDHINEVEADRFIQLFTDHFTNPRFYGSQINAMRTRRIAMNLSSKDRLGFRKLIPAAFRKRLKRGLAGGIKESFPKLLDYWRVEPADDLNILKTAIFQIVVCENPEVNTSD